MSSTPSEVFSLGVAFGAVIASGDGRERLTKLLRCLLGQGALGCVKKKTLEGGQKSEGFSHKFVWPSIVFFSTLNGAPRTETPQRFSV